MTDEKRTDRPPARRGGRFTLEGAEVDVWHYHDGPIFGVLRKEGREFLFEVARTDDAAWDLYPKDDDGGDAERKYTLRELVHTDLHVNEMDLAGEDA